jgi:hypothetical protein
MNKLVFLSLMITSLTVFAAPTPFPVFLKSGFSSILEFDEIPTRVVLGDTHGFQVEKLDHSLVIKALVPTAATNMFAYFKNQEPKLFILTASDEAVPTYYKKFEKPLVIPTTIANRSPTPIIHLTKGRLISTHFDDKKDYLIVDIQISSASKTVLKPQWESTQLISGKKAIAPTKLWAERREVQGDSRVKARFIFAKPNVPRNLHDVSISVPLNGSTNSIKIKLEGQTR